VAYFFGPPCISGHNNSLNLAALIRLCSRLAKILEQAYFISALYHGTEQNIVEFVYERNKYKADKCTHGGELVDAISHTLLSLQISQLHHALLDVPAGV